ncbi:Transforming growth factor beta-1-induced transcript 1 protein [Coemansia nantahalensis]|nr:Transforming growth factor beta-1-induced transcript 1 protein [Coemansia nantahalensis]
MSLESATVVGSRELPPAPAPSVHGAARGQPLLKTLGAGGRETVETIVHSLTDELEALKSSSAFAPQSTDFGKCRASPVTGALQQEDEHFRRRLSSLPEFAPAAEASAARDRRKRMTMTFGAGGPETASAALTCAYCNVRLDDGLITTAKAVICGDVGYCCSNCESILNLAPAGADSAPTAAADAGYDDEYEYDEDGGGDQHALCETCHEPLGDEYVNILGRRFHVMHLMCDDCNMPLYALGGYLQDPSGGSKFYCQRDYLQRFSPTCHACSVQITSGEMVVALGRTYHSECFVCSICQSPFAGDVCYEHNSQPLCEWHWYTQNGLLCSECGGTINNHCVLTRGKKYHQHCAEAKYGEAAMSIDEARRQVKAAKAAVVAS